ncbi:(+)-neomenthol dehydrogenase [Linum perenne]
MTYQLTTGIIIPRVKNIENEWAKGVLSDVDNLTEERVDEVIKQFLNDFNEGLLKTNGWPFFTPGYVISKATLNAHTRIIAKKYPSLCINAVCPGFMKTDINVKTVVTGGNKGIGFEICRQLASNGVTVVLTARDENRGLQAVQKLRHDNIVFHQLDVADSSSISSLADFVTAQFGKLDILVNNAAIFGATFQHHDDGNPKMNWLDSITDTYELAEECFKTNYYGAKRMIETFLPLLQLSDSPRIVNVSAGMGKLTHIKNEWAKGVLGDAENLTEQRIEQVLNKFLSDFELGSLEAESWPTKAGAYTLSKAALNAYTRIVAAKNYPNFCINCVCPGYVKTDISMNTGFRTPEEGARGPVKLALLPDGGPSGCFFDQLEVASF